MGIYLYGGLDVYPRHPGLKETPLDRWITEEVSDKHSSLFPAGVWDQGERPIQAREDFFPSENLEQVVKTRTGI